MIFYYIDLQIMGGYLIFLPHPERMRFIYSRSKTGFWEGPYLKLMCVYGGRVKDVIEIINPFR